MHANRPAATLSIAAALSLVTLLPACFELGTTPSTAEPEEVRPLLVDDDGGYGSGFPQAIVHVVSEGGRTEFSASFGDHSLNEPQADEITESDTLTYEVTLEDGSILEGAYSFDLRHMGDEGLTCTLSVPQEVGDTADTAAEAQELMACTSEFVCTGDKGCRNHPVEIDF